MTDDPIELVSRPSLTLAVAECEADMADVPASFRRQSAQVLAWAAANGVTVTGPLHGVYERGRTREYRMRVGLPVAEPFPAAAGIACYELAAGRWARTLHQGAYTKLADTYRRLGEWVQRAGLQPKGQYVEIYLERHADLDRCQTDVGFRLDDV
jgi:effector-binding domain-containing protein